MEHNLAAAINQIRQHDESGLNYIYSKTYNYVYLRAKNVLKRENDIQELMQDVYLKMWKASDELKEDQLYAWLGKCVYSLGCERYRKKKAREASILEIEKNELEVRKNIDLESTMDVIMQSLEELPDLYQATFYAFYYDYMPVSEIAEVMGCTKEIIINRLNYTRKYMIKALQNFQEEKNIKVAFSVEVTWMALRKWSVEHCMGMTAAQSVYSEICKKANMKPGTIYLEGKEFAGVNNTVVYHKADDWTLLHAQFEKYAPKTGLDNKKLGMILGICALAIAIIIGIVLFAKTDRGESGKENQVNQSQDVDSDKDSENKGNEDASKGDDSQNNDSQNDDSQSDDDQDGDTQNDDTQNSVADDSEYILPESSIRELTWSELESLSKEQLRLARNEIFARHGMIFGVEDLDAYFRTKSWYNPTVSASEFYDVVEMSLIEEANINLIVQVESEK